MKKERKGVVPDYDSFDDYLKQEGITSEETVPTSRQEQGEQQAEGITAYELQRMEFPPIRWIVQDILPAGFCVLAGKPKAARKSWTALNLALAVAHNGLALGSLQVDSGEALYLDLESNQRRMRTRIEKAMGKQTTTWSRNLHIFSSWPSGLAGIDLMETWMMRHPETRLIVVDILVNMRPRSSKGGDQYQEESLFIQELSQLAGRHNIACLALHHTRKTRDTSDVFQDIYGGVGLQGAVDNMIVIDNSSSGATLHMRGRDIEDDAPRPIRWDGAIFSWVITSQMDAISGDTRQQIIDVLMDAGEELTLSQLCELLPTIGVPTIQSTIQRMVKDEQVVRAGRGRYTINEELFKHAHRPGACLSA
jgi:hypothetical protein